VEILNKIIAKKNDVFGAEPITIAFIGDSVTQGCFEMYRSNDRGYQTECRVEEGYHTKLRSILQMLYPSVPINIIYGGINGDNATRGLGRVQRDICRFKPDLTIFSFGLNDSNFGLENLEKYKESLKGIIDALRACGSEMIFMTPNMVADQVSEEINDADLRAIYKSSVDIMNVTFEKYIDAARAVCAENNVTVCDCTAIWKKLKDNEVDIMRLLADRINHPIEQMHWLFAFMLIRTIFDLK
jgi:lysophospholipase L1-like esterase